MTIPELAEELNRQSDRFEIGNLQEIRKRLRGLKQPPCQDIFGPQSIHDEFAFHLGSREGMEIQFNVGKEQGDEGEMVRYGVAFSLEPSRTLTTIDPLRRKIGRFNSYVNERYEDFAGLSMWHHIKTKGQQGTRSEDRAVGSIPDELMKSGVFIMLGTRVANDDLDVREILSVFDRLLPLYRYVEGEEEVPPSTTTPDFKPGCPSFIEKTAARQTGQTVDVALRHNTLQMAMYKHLCQEAGDDNVQMERPLALGVRVDAVVRCNGREAFYEVKVASTVRSCVRAALGQLIEYCHWPSADRASEMIVVGEAELDSDSGAYLDLLRQKYGLPIWYRRIDIDNDVLVGKA